MRVHINHTLLMLLTSFFNGSIHLSMGKSDFETLIYFYSDVMCYFLVFYILSVCAAIKAAPRPQPSTVELSEVVGCWQWSSKHQRAEREHVI